jgi:hypothetical protein
MTHDVNLDLQYFFVDDTSILGNVTNILNNRSLCLIVSKSQFGQLKPRFYEVHAYNKVTL